MHHNELPVFFDRTGKRWRNVKLAFAGAFIGVSAAALVLVPGMAEPVHKGLARPAAVDDAKKLESIYDSQNTPVVGSGQFIRAAKVGHSQKTATISDVFSGQTIRQLTAAEVVAVNGSSYILERYGNLPDNMLALTFDDGPDPKFTPPLLDLLSSHKAPSTFFVVGAGVVKHPEITERVAREGHVIGNHTFSHMDFDFGNVVQNEQEITQTSRVITAAANRYTGFFRVPYGGSTDQSLRDSIKGVLEAQRLGYVPVAYDYDTRDWAFKKNQKPDPAIFDGNGKILLLHDSGGDRSHTLAYVSELLKMAKQSDYKFVTLADISPVPGMYGPARPAAADKASMAAGQAGLVWPARLIRQLFALNVVVVLLVTGTNIILAFLQRRRDLRGPKPPRSFRPSVSVIIPAFNEEKVLESAVRSVLKSSYRKLDVVIIDDGSTDGTLKTARRLAAGDKRVKVFHQSNHGKAIALNHGIRRSKGEIIICVDADTQFTRRTVRQLVGHFCDPRVGGVSGYVRPGNVRNWLTRWQALEYITSISIERSAQAFLGAITVVSGACGAWRRAALLEAGGFSHRTLAEDCDVALDVHQAGYRIVQDRLAISYTECPLTLSDLAKQRFRWVFGNIQAYWRHRQMFLNKKYGWLGMLVLPNAAFGILMPLIFWPLLLGLTLANILAGRWWVVALFIGLVMLVQFAVAWAALRLSGESPRHLVAVPLTRLVYGPLRTYILYRSLLTILRGALVGWNKLNRTKTVTSPEIEPGRSPTFQAVRQAAEE